MHDLLSHPHFPLHSPGRYFSILMEYPTLAALPPDRPSTSRTSSGNFCGHKLREHCLSRRIMRRRELRPFRPQMCLECEEAVKAANSNASGSSRSSLGGQPDGLSPVGGKSVALGRLPAEASDPAIQLTNIVVELEDGCVERISMNDNESAEEVATKVCQKNGLPNQFVALLAEHIVDRYPTRSVDKVKEVAETSSDQSKESKTAKNQSEIKTVKKKRGSKSESQSESSTSGDSKGK